jgi:hypothetical protein
LVCGETGEVVGGLGGQNLVVEIAAFTVDPHDLVGVWEEALRRFGDRGGASVDAAVPTAR